MIFKHKKYIKPRICCRLFFFFFYFCFVCLNIMREYDVCFSISWRSCVNFSNCNRVTFLDSSVQFFFHRKLWKRIAIFILELEIDPPKIYSVRVDSCICYSFHFWFFFSSLFYRNFIVSCRVLLITWRHQFASALNIVFYSMAAVDTEPYAFENISIETHSKNMHTAVRLKVRRMFEEAMPIGRCCMCNI